MTCSKMYGMLRDPGVPLSLEQVEKSVSWMMVMVVVVVVVMVDNDDNHPQCDLEEGGGFMHHTCYNEEDLEPYNCKRSKFEISVSLR